MLPDGGRRRRGLPFLEVAPRPGFQGVRSGSFRSVCGAAGGRRFPTDDEASPGRCRRPMSHAVPAVFAPRARTPEPSSRSSVTTRIASASRVAKVGPPRSMSSRIASSALRRPAWRTVTPAAIRSPRRPGSGGPSKTSSTAIDAGIAARIRPISAAGGTLPPPRASAGRRFDPSTISRAVSASGSREVGMRRRSYAAPTAARSGSSKRRLRSAT